MYGLYITIQDKKYPTTPNKIRNGMILASTAAASKASIGYLKQKSDITKSQKLPVSDISFNELKKLSAYLKTEKLLETGICSYKNFDIITIPTKIINKPKTLVGIGDTISSFSIIGAV